MQASQLKLTSLGMGPGSSLEAIFQKGDGLPAKMYFSLAFDSAALSLPNLSEQCASESLIPPLDLSEEPR